MADTKQTAAASSHKLQQKDSRTLLSTGVAMQRTAELKVILVTANELSLYLRGPTII